jgi:HEAT repeat protein
VTGLLGLSVWLATHVAQEPISDAVPNESPASNAVATAGELALRGSPDARRASQPSVAPLLEDLLADDEAISETAITRLLERLNGMTPDELLDLALVPADSGRREALVHRAEERLLRFGPSVLPLLPRLFDLLERGNESERDTAASVVRVVVHTDELDPRARQGAPEVVAALEPHLPRIRSLVADERQPVAVRESMLLLIGALGPAAVDAAPSLVAWLSELLRFRERFRTENPGVFVRWHSTNFDIQDALTRMGSGALPAIVGALRSDDSIAALELRLAIEDMGPEAAPALRALLGDQDPAVRAAALRSLLRSASSAGEAVAIARAHVRDPDPRVRRATVEDLYRHGDGAGALFVAALSDPDEGVRLAALGGLGEAPRAAQEARAALMTVLRSGSSGERLWAADAVAALGPSAAEATPWLLDLLAEGSRWLEYGDVEGPACRALTALGRAALPRVVEAAASEVEPRRGAALAVLASQAALELRDLEPLARTLSRRDGVLRMRTAAVLVAADGRDALGTLIEGLSSPDEAVRVEAAKGLQRAEASAVAALPQLLAGLRAHADRRRLAEGAAWREELESYRAFAKAVRHVGRDAPEEMVSLLEDPSGEVREAAQEALTAAGDSGIAAIRSAWSALDDDTRLLALRALVQSASAGAEALLASTLADPSPRIRLAAAEVALHRDGGEAGVRTLLELLDGPDEAVTEDAARLLHGEGVALAPFEDEIVRHMPPPGTFARTRVQDLLDTIRAR